MLCHNISIRLALAMALVVTLHPKIQAQLEVDQDQQYLLLATQRTGTMQEKLDETAKLGFRVVTGSPASNEIVFFLGRAAEPSNPYAY